MRKYHNEKCEIGNSLAGNMDFLDFPHFSMRGEGRREKTSK